MMSAPVRQTILLQDREYQISVFRRIALPCVAPRLVVVSCLPNTTAVRVLELCVRSFLRYSSMPVEIWVVDNASNPVHAAQLHSLQGVNLVLNATPAIPPGGNGGGVEPHDFRWGSYANAVALEIAARVVDPGTKWFGTFHMDTMATHPRWLEYLLGKVHGDIAAAGVRMDVTRTPSGILHVLGMIIDFQLFRSLELSFYPDLPRYDVGDLVTVAMRDAGYSVFAARNTLWDNSLIASIPDDSEFKEWPVDRSLDDDGNVFFLHLGRGVRKSVGDSVRGMTADEWVRRGENHLQYEMRHATAR